MSDIKTAAQSENTKRLPPWLKKRLTSGEKYTAVLRLIRQQRLHTVCQSAACPNQQECWNAGTATFMILGNVCTRGCSFCNVPKGSPSTLDRDEPARVADAIAALGLDYAVITSVTRDDLQDGGAAVFADTIRAIRAKAPKCAVEVLVPDFQGATAALDAVLDASPHVLNHNLETVPRLYPEVRPRADYRRSLALLQRANAAGFTAKSGLMLGIGEERGELRMVMKDLREAGCDILTLGQYLRPNKRAVPVSRYYEPKEFEDVRSEALTLGFARVVAGPLVRSSYQAKMMSDSYRKGIL